MNEQDRMRCERLRYESKKGRYISPDDFEFLQRMWREHPDDYKAIGAAVLEQTAAEINPLLSPHTNLGDKQ